MRYFAWCQCSHLASSALFVQKADRCRRRLGSAGVAAGSQPPISTYGCSWTSIRDVDFKSDLQPGQSLTFVEELLLLGRFKFKSEGPTAHCSCLQNAMFKQAAKLLRQQLDFANLSKASREVTFLCVSLERAAAYAAPSASRNGCTAFARASDQIFTAVRHPAICRGKCHQDSANKLFVLLLRYQNRPRGGSLLQLHLLPDPLNAQVSKKTLQGCSSP